MLMSAKFKSIQPENGFLTVSRMGVASSIMIPEHLLQRVGYDANVDAEKNAVVFSEGDTVFILTDKFGVIGGENEEVDTYIFFVDGGMVIQLNVGKIVLEDEDGQIYFVDEVGDIDYPAKNAKITYYDTDHIRGIVSSMTKYRYSLPEKSALVEDYVNNLLYNIQFHYHNTNTGYVATMRVVDYYGDLAMDRFIFTDYGEVTEYEDDDEYDAPDVGDLVPVDDDEPEEEEYDMDNDEYESVF